MPRTSWVPTWKSPRWKPRAIMLSFAKIVQGLQTARMTKLLTVGLSYVPYAKLA